MTASAPHPHLSSHTCVSATDIPELWIFYFLGRTPGTVGWICNTSWNNTYLMQCRMPEKKSVLLKHLSISEKFAQRWVYFSPVWLQEHFDVSFCDLFITSDSCWTEYKWYTYTFFFFLQVFWVWTTYMTRKSAKPWSAETLLSQARGRLGLNFTSVMLALHPHHQRGWKILEVWGRKEGSRH